jgi:AbiV family abortive infection protein
LNSHAHGRLATNSALQPDRLAATAELYVGRHKRVRTEIEMNKSRLSLAMSACVENGQRLHQDAEWLGSDRSATTVALCILAQEEFAKAFLLHLVCEGIIPWTAKVRESLHNHKYKQLVGLIMEWLSPSDDAFRTRIAMGPGEGTLPTHVADAMKLYVEKVLPQGHILIVRQMHFLVL